MNNNHANFFGLIILGILGLYGCSNQENNNNSGTKKDSSSTAPKEKPIKSDAAYKRPPIVQIVDTLSPKRTVIYCKDSAASFDRISLKLGNIYGEKLGQYIKKNKLTPTGAPMAWYKTQSAGSDGKAPYFFEAGIPVNKAGKTAVPGIRVRELAAGKAVIAHFFGPFDLLNQGYDAIKEWMKDNKKTAAGAPYEIYLTDPIDKNGKPVDPYKIQTDIIFPVK
ncbi:MAG: GyrI-like domain-containing protein [Chitinophagaceae bacterium]|nr:GyrI-like domain-containing protein [Chitinophagaceae bacterium]